MHESLKLPFFEGWYFRFVSDHFSAAIIIGIAKAADCQEAFIQIFHTDTQQMEKLSFTADEIHYQADPFELTLQRCVLLKNYLHIEAVQLSRTFDFQFQNAVSIHRSLYAPTIMGPFAYLKHMQCNHAILNLGSKAVCYMEHEKAVQKMDGLMYQEKDWGTSFPDKYVWVQSNCCEKALSVLFLSCATIPLGALHFTGIIMVLKDQAQEFCFASYYGAVLTKTSIDSKGYHLRIRQGCYRIICTIRMNQTYLLEAPQQGRMNRTVQECLLGDVDLRISKHGKTIRNLVFHKCGIENDHFFP